MKYNVSIQLSSYVVIIEQPSSGSGLVIMNEVPLFGPRRISTVINVSI